MPRPKRKPFIPPRQDTEHPRQKRKRLGLAKATDGQRRAIERLAGVYPKNIPSFTGRKADDFINRLLAGEAIDVQLVNGQTLRLAPLTPDDSPANQQEGGRLDAIHPDDAGGSPHRLSGVRAVTSAFSIGKVTITPGETGSFWGRTLKNTGLGGVATFFDLTGPPGVKMQLADVEFVDGQRDVRTVSCTGPNHLTKQLEEGWMAIVAVHRFGLRRWMGLQQDRLSRRLWSEAHEATIEELNAGAGIGDSANLLLSLGATSVGRLDVAINDRDLNVHAVLFPEEANLVPVAAYTITRVLPLLNLYAPVHAPPPSGRRVYVIELSDDAGGRDTPDYPNVYVGETGLTPEERFEVHKQGGRTASSKVTNYGVRLRQDLYEHLPPYRSEQVSVEAEKQLKADLEEIGYRVWGGTKGMYEAFKELSD